MKRCAILFGLLSSAAAYSQSSYGIEFDGDVWNLDTGTLIGNAGATGFSGGTIRDGKFYANRTNLLYTVSTTTGAGTLLGTMALGGATDVRALACDSNGDLYVVVNNVTSDQLWRVDRATLIGTLVGNIGDTGIQGAEFDLTGKLFAWSVTPTAAGGLWTINPTTGVGTDVNPSVGAIADIQTLYSFGTFVYGYRDQGFNIPTGGGSVTLFQDGPYTDIRGSILNQEYVRPTTATIKLGQLTQGNLSSVARRDGSTMRVCKFFTPNQQTPPVNVEFTATITDSAPKGLSFLTYSRMESSGSFAISTSLFNWQTGQFFSSAFLSIGQGFNTNGQSVNAADSPNFVSSTGQVRGRVEIKQTGPTGAANWCWEVDQALFLVGH